MKYISKACSLLALLTTLVQSVPSFAAKNNVEDAFTKIYENGVWAVDANGNGTSGPGSTIENTKEYVAFLQKFMKKNKIKSVVDIGCGDWEFSQHINWKGINYKGYDVVKKVVDRNQKKFGNSNISFYHADVSQISFPKADLLICKDVMMHIPNQSISAILSQLSKFKYCIITNDVLRSTLSSTNPELSTVDGGFRALDITQPPFSIKAKKVFIYRYGNVAKKVVVVKNY